MLITAERDGYFGLLAKPALEHPWSKTAIGKTTAFEMRRSKLPVYGRRIFLLWTSSPQYASRHSSNSTGTSNMASETSVTRTSFNRAGNAPRVGILPAGRGPLGTRINEPMLTA